MNPIPLNSVVATCNSINELYYFAGKPTNSQEYKRARIINPSNSNISKPPAVINPIDLTEYINKIEYIKVSNTNIGGCETTLFAHSLDQNAVASVEAVFIDLLEITHGLNLKDQLIT